jgi:hypothetical protein
MDTMKTREPEMKEEPKSLPWLSLVERAPEDGPLLRLMMVNPMNSEMCVIVNDLIDTDPDGYAPNSADLHTFSYPTVEGIRDKG